MEGVVHKSLYCADHDSLYVTTYVPLRSQRLTTEAEPARAIQVGARTDRGWVLVDCARVVRADRSRVGYQWWRLLGGGESCAVGRVHQNDVLMAGAQLQTPGCPVRVPPYIQLSPHIHAHVRV